MKRWSRLVMFMAAISCGSLQPAFADGLIRDGVGAISTGRGGTNLGFADNGGVLLDNPAGMVNVAGCGLCEIGIDTLFCDVNYSDPQNDDVSNITNPVPLPTLAYIKTDGELAWGIGVFAPAGFVAEYEMQSQFFGPALYKSIGALGKVLPGVAYQATDRLSIGATLGLAVSHVEYEGPYTVQTGFLFGTPTNLDLQSSGAAVTGSVGLQYELTECTTLGVCYTEESRFELDGSARVAVPFFPQRLDFDAEVDIVWPRSLAIGLMHELCCCRRVSADVIWYDWSHAFDQLDLRLTNPNNPLAFLLGPTISDSLALDWEDTVSVRLGYEQDLTECDTWRCGYVHHNSPVPDSTLNPYLDGVLEHAFSLGYTRRHADWSLNLAYQYSFSPEREIEDSALIGGDFDDSTFRAQAQWFCFSVLVPF